MKWLFLFEIIFIFSLKYYTNLENSFIFCWASVLGIYALFFGLWIEEERDKKEKLIRLKELRKAKQEIRKLKKELTKENRTETELTIARKEATLIAVATADYIAGAIYGTFGLLALGLLILLFFLGIFLD